MDLDYRAIGLSAQAADILIFFIDLTCYGVLDSDKQHLLRYLAEGRTPGEIAGTLGTSERTAHRRIAELRQAVAGYLRAA